MSKSGGVALQTEDHITLHGSPLSSFECVEQPSLHEIRMANAIKVGPGDYRLSIPKISPSISRAVNRMLRSPQNDTSAIGPDEADYSLASDIAYVKVAATSVKPCAPKRVYYPDVPVSDESLLGKRIRIIKGGSRRYQDSEDILMNKTAQESGSSEVVASVNSNEQPEMLMEPAIDVSGYEEVAEPGEYDDEYGNVVAPPFLVSESHEVVSGALYRELKGENNYLKEQLQASV
ncbi:hypothetical protein KIN20_002529 [Parelaphostrongylus tenuis]|uniref:Uncharacterized protein n=1 Tax=Parelaphostrongylus tenuis TaxID=148309 RepID=A0AAD5LYP2_PARTN|nr:hypothetical protein KIN20_002529 [Parelaphostrongylus tenuis]